MVIADDGALGAFFHAMHCNLHFWQWQPTTVSSDPTNIAERRLPEGGDTRQLHRNLERDAGRQDDDN
jgi:hypothetical protein